MRKLFIVFAWLLILSGVSFGAVSDDVYVRQDVFSARMDAFMSEIRLMNQELRSEMKELHSEVKQDIQNLRQEVKQEIQEIRQEVKRDIQAVNARIDVTNARLDDLYTTVYWGLAIIGIFVALIAFAPVLMTMYQNLRKPSITLEEVERLIEAKFSEKL